MTSVLDKVDIDNVKYWWTTGHSFIGRDRKPGHYVYYGKNRCASTNFRYRIRTTTLAWLTVKFSQSRPLPNHTVLGCRGHRNEGPLSWESGAIKDFPLFKPALRAPANARNFAFLCSAFPVHSNPFSYVICKKKKKEEKKVACFKKLQRDFRHLRFDEFCQFRLDGIIYGWLGNKYLDPHLSVI